MASTYLHKNQGSPTNAYKFTYSVWLKRSKLGASQRFYQGYESGNNRLYAMMTANDTIFCYGVTGGNVQVNVETTRKYRDTNGWYNVVLKGDSTLSTATDRFQIWVNGVRETALTISSNINQNTNFGNLVAQSNNTLTISGQESHSELWDGLMSHIHFTDGYAYDASAFGSTDSTTGEWKINTSPSVIYGNTGYFILKDGNSVTDQSGNSNNFTVGGGTLTKTEDCPSSVFCTWNPNYRSARKDMTLTNGNTFIFEQNSGDSGVSGNIAVSSGKYYWEQIIAQVNGTNAAVIGGLHTTEDWNESPTDALSNNTCGMRANGNVYKNGSDLGNFTTADPNGDIFGIGFDADNGSVYFWRNGTALNSGNAIITGLDMTKTWIPFGVQHGGARVTTSTNFGNGYFQTTAVSSAGTNASNNGIFEYDVPSGYTALSTKGLNL